MKTSRFLIFLIFFIQSFTLSAQGEALENSYLKTGESFSKIHLDTLWDYFPDGKISLDSLIGNATWTKVNPITFQTADKKPLSREGVSWFQQKFILPDTLNGKPMAIFVGHFGASEIYLDGKLVERYGDVWATSGTDKSYISRQPIIQVLTNTPVHSLSIRYAPHDFDKITSPHLLRGFFVSLCPASEAFLRLNIDAFHLLVSSTIYIVFAVFFFCIFIFYPKRLASLMTVFVLVDFALLFSSGGFSGFTTNPSLFFLSNLFWKIAVATASLFYLLFVYTLYYQKFTRLFWWVLAFIIFKILCLILNIEWLNNYLGIAGLLLIIETFRILYLGIKNKRVGFWILFIGEVLGMILFFVFIFDIFGLNSDPRYNFIKEIGGFLSDLSAPLSLALQLALEFGSSNRSLQQQLVAVQNLSKENLEKEQEKQYILSTQNETLEKQVTERTAELVHKNRDLEIEAALEKIRSASLAMHHSNELEHVVAVFYEKLKELGLVFDGGTGIHLFTEGSKDAVIWVYDTLQPPTKVNLPYDADAFVNNTIILDVWDAHNTGTHIFNKNYSFEEKNRYFNYVFKHNDYNTVPEEVRNFILSVPNYTASFIAEKHSLLGANSWTGQLFSETDFGILKRVAKVFEQAYVRFLDLQKAEAQAREAQIEVALERVRSKTMAMQHSNQLREIAGITLEQLQSLGFTFGACSIIIMNAETGDMTWWISGFENDYPTSYGNIYFEHPFYLEQLNNWKEGKKYAVMVCEGEAKKEYDKFIFSKTEFVKIPIELQKIMQSFEKITFSNAYMKHGALSWSTEPLAEEDAIILQRFATVFEQSYTRFLDLQTAEAQAREAQIEVALERVRSRAMAMQKSDELSKLIGTVYNELTKLDLGLNHCVIWIFDPKNLSAKVWMVSSKTPLEPQGLFLPYSEHEFYNAFLSAWREKKNELWIYDFNGSNKKTWDEFVFTQTDLALIPEAMKQGMQNPERVIVTASVNNFGMLTAVGLIPLYETQKDIVSRFGKVFDSTYTRFNDLKQAEALAEQAHLDLIQIQTEKKRAEEALTILKATQNQLIQSEKLASLGELTAGIAHEIQNPLNFVNNFSELNVDLVNDIKDEMHKPEIDKVYVEDLLKDLTNNEKNINHHGKRAASIVSGMLEHSRASTGKKELTDVNKLADEYFRLSYHGLRAKNKDFNAEMITDFDTTIPKIEIIPQDVGRVILNLINNAFYAVNEKRTTDNGQQTTDGDIYSPTVTVTTLKTDNAIEIKVKDNGIGMPESVRAKVFQPFFTTKPTGQGTGLGLSLAYDIITKGHGGSLSVESTEGVGSEFIIVL